MAESKIPLGPIRVDEEFVCQAIPGKKFAGTFPENATPSPVCNEGIVIQRDDLLPQNHSAHLARFHSRLDRLPTAEILALIQKGGLSPEQLRAVREAIVSRLATRQSELQQLNEILDATSTK